jgi:hypothetical protein
VGTIRVKSLSAVAFPSHIYAPGEERAVPTTGPLALRSQFEQLQHILNPNHPLARESGIEWWVGVPDPIRIERTIAEATRRLNPPRAPPVPYGR